MAAVRANPARPVCMDGRIEPGQSGLGERRQRRPLATAGDVSGAEVTDHGNPGFPGQQGAVADLPGDSPVGLVDDGVAVKADGVDGVGLEIVVAEQAFHRLGMEMGQLFGHRLRFVAVIGIDAQDGAQPVAEPVIVDQGLGRAETEHPLSVGVDDGGVDAVHGGAAHQADCRLNAFDRHLRPPFGPLSCAWAQRRDCANNTDSINPWKAPGET